MNTFTKLPEFPFFVVHRAERYCVYTVTRNIEREGSVSLRWRKDGQTSSTANYYTKVDVLGYLKSGMWLLCDKDGNIIENYTEEKEVMVVQKKLKPSDVKGYVRGKHQPYTDYNQEIGMDDTPDGEFESLLKQAHGLVKQIELLWDKAKSQIDTKQENIRKELEFAEAKKARLEKHIDVLKSKLQ